MEKFRKWNSQCLSNKIFDIVNWILMLILLIVCVYPLYYILLVSFSTEVVGVYFWPKGFTIEGYQMILSRKDVWLGYANTVYYTVLGVLASLAVTLPFAYALSRKDFVGRQIITKFIMVTMFISGGLIPTYLNMYNLGLTNTRAAIILLSLTSTYNIILARSFFSSTIPDELYDASQIDGCSNGKFFFIIVVPLSKAITAVMALYFGVARWNSYYNEMIYLRDEDMYPLALVLRRLLWEVKAIMDAIDQGLEVNEAGLMANLHAGTIMQYCLIVVSTVPMLIIYPKLQKYFAQGVMIGSVKG